MAVGIYALYIVLRFGNEYVPFLALIFWCAVAFWIGYSINKTKVVFVKKHEFYWQRHQHQIEGLNNKISKLNKIILNLRNNPKKEIFLEKNGDNN